MLKNRSLLILVIILLVAVLTVLSCGRKGSLILNLPPEIEISDYSGIARPDSVETDSAMAHVIGDLINPDIYDSLFYQEIFWRAWDVDGVVRSFAYRIGTWDSLSEDWLYDQSYGVRVSEEGWVLHLQPNGEYDIWTPLKERFPKTAVYFTATDTSDYKKNFGKFEVKCKDNYGEECLEPAIRYFVSWSDVPSTNISTTQGELDSVRVGAALTFVFSVLEDNDPFGYGSEAAYFEYRLKYYRTIGTDTLKIGTLGQVTDSTEWYNTEGYPKKDEVLLMAEYHDGNPYGKPVMRVNEKFDNGTYEVTEIQAKSVDKAGIIDPEFSSMVFFVRGHFKPQTMPFMSQWTDLPRKLGGREEANGELNILPKIFVLGKHSYLPYLAETSVDIPSQIIMGETHYADRFYMDRNNNISALWSNDIQIYMKWGYLGEYEFSEGKRSRECHTYSYDENLDEYFQYYCDVEYMDIQLDGSTEGLPPVGTVITDDVTGEEWMRLPIYDEQNCKLYGLTSGEHTFMVRAVDFQGAVDPTPESLVFVLYEIVPLTEKDGVFLVDDTYNDDDGIFASDSLISSFYDNLLEGSLEEITKLTIPTNIIDDSIATKNSQMRKIRLADDLAPFFAPSDIQQYKLIVWYSNNPKINFFDAERKVHLVNHYNVLSSYINSGGNLVFTGTRGIWDPVQAKNKFLKNYAGLADSSSALCNLMEDENWYWGTPNQENSMFKAAKGVEDFSDIDSLQLYFHLFCWHDYNPYFPDTLYFPEYWFFTPLGAIGNVTFLELSNAEPIFTCVSDNMEIHQVFSGACIGTKYTKQGTTGKVYILGFPLYYIQLNDAEAFINKVFDEVGVFYD